MLSTDRITKTESRSGACRARARTLNASTAESLLCLDAGADKVRGEEHGLEVLTAFMCLVPGQTKDVEEKEQCEQMHELIRQYKLEGQLRWLVAQKDRVANGELYRYIAGALRCCCYKHARRPVAMQH